MPPDRFRTGGPPSIEPASFMPHPGTVRTLREQLTQLLNGELGRLDPATGGPAGLDVANMANMLLRDALREHASDIHLDPQYEGVQVRFRIDGVLHDAALLTHDEGQRLLRHLKAFGGLDPVASFRPEDARLTYVLDDRELDLRLACVPCMGGQKLTIRLLERSRVAQRFSELGMGDAQLQAIHQWLTNMSGMFLCTGPTGSGKTTTLYALLHELKLLDRSVVTIEDPVEYQIDGITQMQVDVERGLTFAEGLRAMLRLDPDFLLVGEIRDPISARTAVEAAVTGRVLMSTLHSRDPIGTVTALRQWGLDDHEIASSLEVVVTQRLVRQLCPYCRQETSPPREYQKWAATLGWTLPDRIWQATGCPTCRNIGYQGRSGVFEVWYLNEQDRTLILNHADEVSLRRNVKERWGGSLFLDGLAKLTGGVTSIEELRAVLGDCSRIYSPATLERRRTRRPRRATAKAKPA
jgi:general secretion pathway protein E